MEHESLRQIPHLPEEIITDILLKLPVKSLLKFKATSKSWRSLISSKHFVKTHLKNSTKNPTFVHHRMLAITLESHNYKVQHCSLPSLLFQRVTHAIRVDFPIHDSVYSLHLVGCCNGLACIIINRRDFCLWNPSTRESKKLPNFDAGKFRGLITEHGFGFDENSGDYKVYGILYSDRGTIVKTYSLKTNYWKRINEFRCDALYFITGKFVSGNLHWIRKERRLMDWEWYISSFDLRNEVYGIVEQPSVLEYDRLPTLGVLDGCLSVIYYYLYQGWLDLWVLKQYGVKDSWSKVTTVSFQGFILSRLECWVPFYYVISPNGEVLFHDGYGTCFRAYNMKEDLFWDPKMIGFCKKFIDFDVYVESLVSINVAAVED